MQGMFGHTLNPVRQMFEQIPLPGAASNCTVQCLLLPAFPITQLCFVQGVLGHTLNPVRQMFERIASPAAAEDAEACFQHFKKHTWLRVKETGSSGEQKWQHKMCLCTFAHRSEFSMCQLPALQEAHLDAHFGDWQLR